MSTGDILNNLERLRRAVRRIRYGGELQTVRAREGDPKAFLPIIHFSLLSFSHKLAHEIAEKGYELYGKSDLRFIEGVFRLFRTEFNYQPRLTVEQFFSQGFAELKMILTVDVIEICREQHRELMRQHKASKPASRPRSRETDRRQAERAHLFDRTGTANASEREQSFSTSFNSHGELGPRGVPISSQQSVRLMTAADTSVNVSPNTSMTMGPRSRGYDSLLYTAPGFSLQRDERLELSDLQAFTPSEAAHSQQHHNQDVASVTSGISMLSAKVSQLAERMANIDETQMHLRQVSEYRSHFLDRQLEDELKSADSHSTTSSDTGKETDMRMSASDFDSVPTSSPKKAPVVTVAKHFSPETQRTQPQNDEKRQTEHDSQVHEVIEVLEKNVSGLALKLDSLENTMMMNHKNLISRLVLVESRLAMVEHQSHSATPTLPQQLISSTTTNSADQKHSGTWNSSAATSLQPNGAMVQDSSHFESPLAQLYH